MTPPQNSFPIKTALALGVSLAALAVLHFAQPGKGLDPHVTSEMAHVNLLRHAPPANDTEPEAAPTANEQGSAEAPATTVNPHGVPAGGLSRSPGDAVTSQPGAGIPGQPGAGPGAQPGTSGSAGGREISADLIDDAGALDPFFAALHRLDVPDPPGAKPQVVTILHYGDSPTTADLITGDARALLQQRFGDAGQGYLLTAKPWAWYGHRNVDLTDHGWTTSTAVGKGREDVYGLGGASFLGAPGAGSHIALQAASTPAKIEIEYLAQPGGGALDVSANDQPVQSLSTQASATQPAWSSVLLPAGVKTIDLKPASGSVRLFGETFLTGRRGVVYDSLGLNGASTSVLSNGVNAADWAAELRHAAPALVVINYGTNESSFGSYVDRQYEPTLRNTIARIRAAVPGTPILVMSPMDRGRRAGVDQIETYDTIPRIVAIQRRVAAELGCAFFDTFDAMGGDGTMARWYSGRPRLVAGDLIHPTPQGASIVAHLFVKDLMVGYDRYLQAAGAAHEAKQQQVPHQVPAAEPVP